LAHLVLAHLFVKVSRPEESEETFSVFEKNFSIQAATCYYQSDQSKVEAIP